MLQYISINLYIYIYIYILYKFEKTTHATSKSNVANDMTYTTFYMYLIVMLTKIQLINGMQGSAIDNKSILLLHMKKWNITNRQSRGN